ncbi:MAG: hypothetical protein HFI86_09315 [Bacilli bacterium]|nr:hypothetical protein [Bacilli bacterium]
MDNRIIKYENVRNEKYYMINLHRNNDIDILLIHEFETDKGNDYIVVGESKAGITNVTRESATWCNLISEAVSAYKTDTTVLDNNEDTYKKVANIPRFYPTKEGYDLITHKFLNTNNEIIRTVGLVKSGDSSYKDYTVLKYNNEYAFMSFDDYDKIYLLHPEEFEKMNLQNMVSFVKANLNKVKCFINFNNNYSEYVRLSLFNYSGVSISTSGLEFLKSLVNTIDIYNGMRKENIETKKK